MRICAHLPNAGVDELDGYIEFTHAQTPKVQNGTPPLFLFLNSLAPPFVSTFASNRQCDTAPKVVAKGQAQRLATGCGRAHRANAAVQPRGPTRRSQVLVKCIFQEYAAAYSRRVASDVCVEKRHLEASAWRVRFARSRQK
jgi:hypothetical protein